MADAFKILLAGQIIRIEPLFPQTQAFCKGYLTEGEESLCVKIEPSDIAFEQEKAAREAEIRGLPVRRCSGHYLETLAVYRKIAESLLDYHVLLFHGSALAVDGEGYLFAAKSGTGKSTHARLWREQFGARAVMINDDKPLLKLENGGVLVCGTPWDGKHRLSSNRSVPLKALCLLTRSEETKVERISPRTALPILMQQSYRPADPALLKKTLALVDQLAREVPLYHLECSMDAGAALASYNGIHEKTSGSPAPEPDR